MLDKVLNSLLECYIIKILKTFLKNTKKLLFKVQLIITIKVIDYDYKSRTTSADFDRNLTLVRVIFSTRVIKYKM